MVLGVAYQVHVPVHFFPGTRWKNSQDIVVKTATCDIKKKTEVYFIRQEAVTCDIISKAIVLSPVVEFVMC